MSLSDHEPPPSASTHPAVWDLVKKDIEDRDKYGHDKYGTRLQPFNGRNALLDAYQEALDLVVYLRQRIYEEEQQHKRSRLPTETEFVDTGHITALVRSDDMEPK